MANISFAKPGTAETVTQTVSTPVDGVTVETTTGVNPAAVAVTTSAGPVATRKSLPIGDSIPDFSDIIMPRLNIVQKVGALSEIFPGGALLFNQDTVIWNLPPPVIPGQPVAPVQPPLEIIVIGFKPKRFVEKVEGGGKGLIFDSEEAVIKAGGTLSYQEWELKKDEGMALYQPLSEALLVMFKPDSIKDENGATWVYDIEGRKAVLAMWGMKGSAYTKGAKVFFTARQMGCLRTGYPSFSWNLSTRLEKFGTGNSAYVPVCTPKAATSEAAKSFIASVLEGFAGQ